MIVATHILIELFGCRAPLTDAEFVERTLMKIVKSAKLTPLHRYFHTFDPPGVTGIIALKESHISIHTWPAQSYALVDFLTCGARENAATACRYLEDQLQAERVKITETQCINPTERDASAAEQAGSL